MTSIVYSSVSSIDTTKRASDSVSASIHPLHNVNKTSQFISCENSDSLSPISLSCLALVTEFESETRSLKELHNLLAEYFITKTKSLAELLFTFREKLCIDWQQENVWNNFLHLLQLSGVSSPTLDRLRFCSASAAVFSNDIRNGSDTELVWREDKKISLPSRRNPSRTTIQVGSIQLCARF